MKKFKTVFYYVALANFTCFLGNSLFTLFPVFLKQIGATQSEIGIIFNADRSIVIFASIGIASFIRVKDKIRLLRIGYLILAITFACYMLISTLSWNIMILRVMHGIGFSIALVIGSTIIFDIVPMRSAAEAIGIFGVSGAITNAISPFAGEFLISRGYSFHLLFFISSILVFISFCVTFIIPKTDYRQEATEKERTGFLHLFSNTRYTLVSLLAIIFGGGFGTILTFLPNFILSTTSFRFSYFFVSYICVLVMIRFKVIGRISRFNKTRLLMTMFLSGAIMHLCLNFLCSLTMLVCLGLVYGMIHGILYPVLNAIAVSLVAKVDRGKANAIFTASFNGGIMVFCLPLGFLIDYTQTYLAAFNVSAAAFLIGIGLLAFNSWKYGPLETTREDVPVNIE
jgi:predicted MFS family arabinose efflux permease